MDLRSRAPPPAPRILTRTSCCRPSAVHDNLVRRSTWEAGTTAESPRLVERVARSDTFASLALPQFRLLLAGTALSQVADWMNEVARGWLVLQLTGSAFQLGLLGFIRGIT